MNTYVYICIYLYIYSYLYIGLQNELRAMEGDGADMKLAHRYVCVCMYIYRYIDKYLYIVYIDVYVCV
jgi:hypothetical protein